MSEGELQQHIREGMTSTFLEHLEQLEQCNRELEQRIAKAREILRHSRSNADICTCTLVIDQALDALEGK